MSLLKTYINEMQTCTKRYKNDFKKLAMTRRTILFIGVAYELQHNIPLKTKKTFKRICRDCLFLYLYCSSSFSIHMNRNLQYLISK